MQHSSVLPFEEMLEASGAPYLCGQEPNTLDFLLFGIIQCHCSVYVPPVTALQSDSRLAKLRAWIGRMQERFNDYDHLYSGAYFAPHSRPPIWASPLERTTFWLDAVVMIAMLPSLSHWLHSWRSATGDHDLHDRVSSGLGLLDAMHWYDPRSNRIRV